MVVLQNENNHQSETHHIMKVDYYVEFCPTYLGSPVHQN